MNKKLLYFWLFSILLLLMGCRNENMYSENSKDLQNEARFRQVNKSEIPNIINFLKSKTDNFKLPLKTRNSLNRTETLFGEVDTDNIIESVNEKNDTYYIFSIIPTSNNEGVTYNLEIKSENSIVESAKIILYYPTVDWLLNGNGDYTIFSGTAYHYSLDGTLESAVEYFKGAAGPCDPNPCPDCPSGGGGPTGGGGTSGGGTGGGGGPIGGGGTGGGGPIGGGGTGGGGTGGGGTGGDCGPWVFSHNVFANGVLIG